MRFFGGLRTLSSEQFLAVSGTFPPIWAVRAGCENSTIVPRIAACVAGGLHWFVLMAADAGRCDGEVLSLAGFAVHGRRFRSKAANPWAVSYTHLTLPTN